MDANALATFTADGIGLPVIRFLGHERLSSTYSFEIQANVEGVTAHDLLQQIHAASATLTLLRPGALLRRIHGIIVSASADDIDGVLDVRASLAPRLWLLTQRRGSRIFEDVTAREVVERTLEALSIRMRWRASTPGSRRAYRVQYAETDYDFFRRVLAEDGFVFSFGHDRDDEEEVLVDDQTSGRSDIATPGGRLKLASDAGMNALEEQVLSLGAVRRVSPNRFVARDYDYQRPGFDLHDRYAAPTGDREAGLPLAVTEHDPRFREELLGRGEARRRLGQLRYDALGSRGASTCRALSPGCVVRIDEAAYLVMEVHHEGEGRAFAAANRERTAYRNDFVCAPHEAEVHPFTPRRPRAPSVELATVIGSGSQDAPTDSLGRVRVQFQWDKETEGNAQRSCWIRVNQSWGGAGFGQQWLPRVGMEVLVAFVAGDLEQPVIVGSVYAPNRPPPFGGVEGAAIGGVRTRSTGGDGFHELSFDDRGGRERILLKSERDLAVVVQHDRRDDVRRDESISVGRDRNAIIAGNEVLRVGGDATRMVLGDAREVVVGTASRTSFGDRHTAVTGADHIRVLGGVDQRIGGGLSTRVEGGVRLDTATLEGHVRGEGTVRMGGALTIAVGAAGNGGADLTVRDGVRVDAKRVQIMASDAITFSCGESRIRLDADGIVLSHGDARLALSHDVASLDGKQLSLFGGHAAFGSGESVVVADRNGVRLHGPAVSAFGEKASLELDGNADLRGTKVRLNPPRQNRTESVESRPAAGFKDERVALDLQLVDTDGHPIAHAEYELLLDGEDARTGVTTAAGRIETSARKSTKTGELRVQVAPDTTVSFSLQLVQPRPAREVRGVQERLANAGMYQGPIDGVQSRQLEDAIELFKRAKGLDATREIDDALVQHLEPHARAGAP